MRQRKSHKKCNFYKKILIKYHLSHKTSTGATPPHPGNATAIHTINAINAINAAKEKGPGSC